MEFFGTLGPNCRKREVIAEMLREGMDGVRLNLSHTGLRGAADWIAELFAAGELAGRRPLLIIDLQGPELRVGRFEGEIELTEGQRVTLGADIPVPEAVAAALAPGQEVLLDDGKILLKAEQGARCAVLRGGLLRPGKSVALPGVTIDSPALTAADRENIALAGEYGVTGVMQPFVRSADDLRELRAALRSAGAGDIRIYAKVESLAGIDRLPEYIAEADEIVIARGDLGNSMPLWELPAAQKRIAAFCRAKGKPFMVVTQLLASMERSAVPTRAEVSDVCNAVLDGAASLMVTGETAVGEYPIVVIKYLVRTAEAAERLK